MVAAASAFAVGFPTATAGRLKTRATRSDGTYAVFRDETGTMTAPKPPKPPAGWYPDADGGPGQRYFDGKDWTEHRAGLTPPLPRRKIPDWGLAVILVV